MATKLRRAHFKNRVLGHSVKKRIKKIIEKLRSKVSSSESYWSEQSLNPSADCLTTKSRD